jgi:hypothetical protein
MGYTTEFTGKFNLNKRLDPDTHTFLTKLNETRRMKRNILTSNGTPDPRYGVDGEFFVDGDGMHGQDVDATVVDQNEPPSTQPSLWCGWVPSKDGLHIEWDGQEKFYGYVEWIVYIMGILTPKGYTLSGVVHYQGEEESDCGDIDAAFLQQEVSLGVETVAEAVAVHQQSQPQSNRRVQWD